MFSEKYFILKWFISQSPSSWIQWSREIPKRDVSKSQITMLLLLSPLSSAMLWLKKQFLRLIQTKINPILNYFLISKFCNLCLMFYSKLKTRKKNCLLLIKKNYYNKFLKVGFLFLSLIFYIFFYRFVWQKYFFLN